MRSIHSKMWIQSMGWIFWLAGAASAAMWTIHGGGLVRPAAMFAVAITALGVVLLSRGLAVKGTSWMEAAQYGAASGLVFLLGTLFVEFWWLTVSLACMFAIGRSLRSDDTRAYS